MKNKLLFVFGTRPEAIKLAPLILEFQKHKNLFDTEICVTSQHKYMLKQVLNLFDIQPQYNLNLMKSNQSLEYLSATALKKISGILKQSKPDLVFVQGDTSTVMAASLAAFYQKIKIVHIEAGLRTNDKYSPFPEEINRVITSHIANYHFAPTPQTEQNLLNEGICRDNIWVVGNTVIDALFLILRKIRENEDQYYK
jgi:UDP-N-acetylglucosamine 2-epimerase (non-hydrolysing)